VEVNFKVQISWLGFHAGTISACPGKKNLELSGPSGGSNLQVNSTSYLNLISQGLKMGRNLMNKSILEVGMATAG
jgi:hypothetical protein